MTLNDPFEKMNTYMYMYLYTQKKVSSRLTLFDITLEIKYSFKV